MDYSMLMRIQHDDTGVVWNDVTALFRAAGWTEREPDALHAAFAKSTFKVFVFDGPRLVGVGRTVDDGRYYAAIVDVIVLPDRQRQGVGRAIVNDLQQRLTKFLLVTATAAPAVQAFYEKLGWRRQSTAMFLPRSAEQLRANADGS